MSKSIRRVRLAVVVSHPIQYYVPLYCRLAARDEIDLKVFFTWHAAAGAQRDYGFKRKLRWDIPLTEGYEHELVANTSRSPGTHHFWGLRNPGLVDRVLAWKPDAVHVTGYAFASHLLSIWAFSRRGIPVLFRGDSHLLDDQQRGLRWTAKRWFLTRVYRRVEAALYVGKNNYEYYRTFGVPDSKLLYCPHSIEVERFAEPNEELEGKARQLRSDLKINESTKVLLFTGKFERKKQPLELMSAVARLRGMDLVLLLVGNGELEDQVEQRARQDPEVFRVLPFQNQSRMPVVYRAGDIFILPSAYGETWGLAVNEALASGRRALISDKVGCGSDLIQSERDGAIFEARDWSDFDEKLRKLLTQEPDPATIRRKAQMFDVDVTEARLCEALEQVRRMQKGKTTGKLMLRCDR